MLKQKRSLKNTNVWKQKVSLLHHKAKIHGIVIKTYPCDKCDRTFNSLISISSHRRRNHLDENDVKCKFCNLKCPSKQDLTRHLTKNHNGARLIKSCNLCTKTYIDESSLRDHVSSVHHGKRFKCNKCSKDFISKRNLRRHVKLTHDAVKYSCNLCEKAFNGKSLLMAHRRRVHIEEKEKLVFECELCKMTFKGRNYLNEHKASKHRHC